MKVLVLGAKGNLGGQLVEIFKDYKVFAWDKEDVDVFNVEELKRKVTELSPEVIINAIAYNTVDKCENDSEELEKAKKLNQELPANLVRLALSGNSFLIHYSTDYIFDGKNEEGYVEDSAPSPINKYGETKLAGEEEILKLRDRGLKYYIIRTSKLFGPKGKSEFSKPSFFDIMLKMGEENQSLGEELKIVDEEVSCFTYTKDLAEKTKEIIDNNKEFGIYHVTNSNPCTWYQAVVELFDICNISAKVKAVNGDEFPRPAKRPKYSVLLNTKLTPMRSWQEALKDYLGL